MKKVCYVLFFLLVLMVPSNSHAAVLLFDSIRLIIDEPLPSNWTVIDFSQFDHDFIETYGPVQIGSLVGEDITVDSGYEPPVPPVISNPPPILPPASNPNNPPGNLPVVPVPILPPISDPNNPPGNLPVAPVPILPPISDPINPPGNLPAPPISTPCTSGLSAPCLPVSPIIPPVPSIVGEGSFFNAGPSPEEFKLLIGNGVSDLGINGVWDDEREGYIAGRTLDFQFNDQPINSFGFLFNFESPSTLTLDFAGSSIMLVLTSTKARPDNRGIYFGISSRQEFTAVSLNASKRFVFDDVSFSRTFDLPEPTLPASKGPTAPKVPKAPTPPNLNSLFAPTPPTLPKSPIAPKSPTPPASLAFYSTSDLSIDQPIQTIVNPEPASMLLFGTGLAGVFLRRRQK